MALLRLVEWRSSVWWVHTAQQDRAAVAAPVADLMEHSARGTCAKSAVGGHTRWHPQPAAHKPC